MNSMKQTFIRVLDEESSKSVFENVVINLLKFPRENYDSGEKLKFDVEC